jgi:hypothetical protein
MTLGNMGANGVRMLAAQSRGNAADTSVLMLSRIGKKESKRVAKRSEKSAPLPLARRQRAAASPRLMASASFRITSLLSGNKIHQLT